MRHTTLFTLDENKTTTPIEREKGRESEKVRKNESEKYEIIRQQSEAVTNDIEGEATIPNARGHVRRALRCMEFHTCRRHQPSMQCSRRSLSALSSLFHQRRRPKCKLILPAAILINAILSKARALFLVSGRISATVSATIVGDRRMCVSFRFSLPHCLVPFSLCFSLFTR